MTAYQNQEWRTLRQRYLRNHSHCIRCGAPAEEVDHYMPRKELVAHGFHNPDATHLLQALCGPCHKAKTVAEDGAFGRPIKPIGER